jgi:hypothetical protein
VVKLEELQDQPATVGSQPLRADALVPELKVTESTGRKDDPSAGVKNLRSSVELVSSIIAPSSLVTGLLFYFGWVYTSARSLYFGIDSSILGFSTADYILRSFDVLQVPLGATLVLVLLLVKAHSRLMAWAAPPSNRLWLRRIETSVTAMGALFFSIGLSGLTSRPILETKFMTTHLGLFFGAGALAYAGHLKRSFPDRSGPGPTVRISLLSTVLVALFMTMNLFLAVGQWADAAGRGAAQSLEAALPSARPAVSLYSKQNLHIDGPGVVAIGFADPEAAYRFKYTGLRLLIRSGDKYFLLPTRWSRENAVAIVLKESDSIRLEFTPGASVSQSNESRRP